jgi:hypothetical protein
MEDILRWLFGSAHDNPHMFNVRPAMEPVHDIEGEEMPSAYLPARQLFRFADCTCSSCRWAEATRAPLVIGLPA